MQKRLLVDRLILFRMFLSKIVKHRQPKIHLIFPSVLRYNDGMSNTPNSTAFDRGISPFLQIFLPDKAKQVIEFEADSEVRDRIEQLACKSTEGELSVDERKEYEGFVRANKFIAVVQREARRVLVNESVHE